MKSENRWIWFVVILIFLAGTVLLVITPMGANFDEETHVARIWEFSLGHIIPNSLYHETPFFPSVFYTSSYRRYVNFPVIDLQTWKEQAKLFINFNDFMAYTTRAVYFPTLYVVQAVVMGITGRVFHLPILFIYYFIRLSYLVMYCILVFFTLKILPSGTRIFGIVAAAPACIIQASSVSPDGIIIGVTFLFIAWILFLISDPQRQLTRRQLIITCILILSIGTLKPNSIFILIFLLILPRVITLRKDQKLAILFTSLLAIIISISWSFVAAQFFLARDDFGKDPIGQFITLIKNPLDFLTLFFSTSKSMWQGLFLQTIGISGYGNFSLPMFIYFLFPVVLSLGLLSESITFKLQVKTRIFIEIIGLINVILLFIIFYIIETPVGGNQIAGLQGRYIIPLLPLFIFPLLFHAKWNLKPPRSLIVASMILISVITTLSIYLDYHVVCGRFWLSKEECFQPRYKNWATSDFLPYTPSHNNKLSQTLIPVCNQVTGIKIWVLSNPIDNPIDFRINLLGGGGLSRTLDTNSRGIKENDWFVYTFEPINDIQGKEFYVDISSTSETTQPAIEFGVFPTNEYANGHLVIQEELQFGDLVILYGCNKWNTQ